MAIHDLNSDAILTTFREWSLEDQVALVRSLVRELASHERSANQQASVYDLAGIARTGQDIPSDEQLDAWLDERRMKEA